jgi:hypothetical protein
VAEVSGLRLVHDVLDAQLLDRHERKIGRVDALTLELRDGRPPRVARILTGGPVRAERVGRWMVWISHVKRTLFHIRRPGVDRIPFQKMRRLADTIQLDVDGRELESGHIEGWLADHIICRIPGARKDKR